MLQAGDTAPEFELADETGAQTRLVDLLADGPVVLFFYPAAMTAGCTRASCHFRDLAHEFSEVGARRVGISADVVDKQKAFSDKHSFDFPLLSDPDRRVADAFGVKRKVGFLPNRRATFVIDKDRRILASITSEINMSTHADRALEVLRAGRRTFIVASYRDWRRCRRPRARTPLTRRSGAGAGADYGTREV